MQSLLCPLERTTHKYLDLLTNNEGRRRHSSRDEIPRQVLIYNFKKTSKIKYIYWKNPFTKHSCKFYLTFTLKNQCFNFIQHNIKAECFYLKGVKIQFQEAKNIYSFLKNIYFFHVFSISSIKIFIKNFSQYIFLINQNTQIAGFLF